MSFELYPKEVVELSEKDINIQILEQLREINEKLKVQKRDNDLLTAREIHEQYEGISYNRALEYFKDPHLNFIDDTKTKLVFRCEFERFLKKKYGIVD